MTIKDKYISFSEYKTFISCEFKWWYSYVLKIGRDEGNEALIFGSAIHAAIEHIAANPLDTNYEQIFVIALKNELQKSEGNSKINLDEGKLINEAIKILTELDFHHRFKDFEIEFIEKDLLTPVDPRDPNSLLFKGFIDTGLSKIVKKKKKYLIIDWKTANKPWDLNLKKRDEFFFSQVIFYKHFLAQQENIPKEDLEVQYVVLSRTGVPTVLTLDLDISPETEEKHLNKLMEVVESIKTVSSTRLRKQKYGKDKFLCGWCPLDKTYCNDFPNQKPIENK